MSEDRIDGRAREDRYEGRTAATLGVADWLSLAATPTFAAMALLTAVSDGSDMLCMAAKDTSPFSGMALMYLLMTAFHFTPWLRLFTRPRPGGA